MDITSVSIANFLLINRHYTTQPYEHQLKKNRRDIVYILNMNSVRNNREKNCLSMT